METDEEQRHDWGLDLETNDDKNMDEADEYEVDEDEEYYETTSEYFDESLYGSSWPKTYGESMDMYSNFTPPSVVLQAGTNLARMGSSFLLKISSKQELESSISELLLPTDLENKRLSSLLSREPSVRASGKSLSVQNIALRRRSSYVQSILNGINVLCGVGLLSTPYAIKEGGWLALLVLIAFSVTSCYTGFLLKRCLESTPGLYTYPDIAQAAFGKTGRLIISILLYLELYGASVEFLILMGDNLSSFFPEAYMDILGVHLTGNKLFALVAALAVLPTAWLRDLKLLSYVSAGGVVASVLVAICLMWVGIEEVGFHPSGSALDIRNLPVALGLYGFCYAGHSVFPNIYSSMKNPSKFPSVLLISFAVCTILYCGVAIAGFLIFGERIDNQFTLNMPKQLLASKIAVWTTVVNPLTKYALTISPVALSLEELLPLALFNSHSASLLIRTCLVASTLLVGLSFPFFGLLMALIGSLIAMLIALIIPCASYLSIMRGRLHWSQVTVCSLVIMVGLIGSISGTYISIRRIINNGM